MNNTPGYRPDFISTALSVKFPQFTSLSPSQLVTFGTERKSEITYPHFSLFIHKERRFPIFTATNIDGDLFKRIPRKSIFPSGSDEWSIDERVSEFQWGSKLYSAVKSDFQRGHMTKREDPQWGNTMEEAHEAARATFHFANCVPQLGELNTKDWGALETYILSKEAVPSHLKISVFTGPVLSENDPFFVTEVEGKEVQIPTLFWKVVYYTEDGRHLSCAAFLMGQEAALFKKKIVYRKPATALASISEIAAGSFFQDFNESAIYQVNMSTISLLTGLKFAPAQEFYTDSRPLELIIKKVQVTAMIAEEGGVASINIDEDDRETIFENIQLSAKIANFNNTYEASLADTAFMSSIFRGSSGTADQYVSEIKKNLNYFAAWLPNTPFELGDVGILKNGAFLRLTKLSELDIPFEATSPGQFPADLKYASKGSVTISTKLSGSAVIPGSSLGISDAGALVEFNRENAVVFQATNVSVTSIVDSVTLGQNILKLYQEGKWSKNWIVVSELVTAGSATILISSSKGAKLELKATANLNTGAINIADAAFAFATQFSRSLETQIISEKGLTPLFRLMGIKSSLFVPLSIQPIGISSFDLLVPGSLSESQNEGKVTFGYISNDLHE